MVGRTTIDGTLPRSTDASAHRRIRATCRSDLDGDACFASELMELHATTRKVDDDLIRARVSATAKSGATDTMIEAPHLLSAWWASASPMSSQSISLSGVGVPPGRRTAMTDAPAARKAVIMRRPTQPPAPKIATLWPTNVPLNASDRGGTCSKPGCRCMVIRSTMVLLSKVG
jgi:hypothetical protein